MARTTLSAAKAELHAILGNASTFAPVTALTAVGVNGVYPFEPRPGDSLKLCFVTVEWRDTQPEWWRFIIRVYASTDVDAQLASTMLLAAAQVVDGLLDAQTGTTSPGFGPSEWEGPRFNPDLGALIATTIVGCPRGDLV